jgi:hypothetical protein
MLVDLNEKHVVQREILNKIASKQYVKKNKFLLKREPKMNDVRLGPSVLKIGILVKTFKCRTLVS